MIVEFRYCKPSSHGQPVTDYVEAPDGRDVVAVAREALHKLDEGLPIFSTHHTLVAAKRYVPPDPRVPSIHDWQARSPVKMRDSAGSYDNVICAKCRITGRRYDHDIIGRVKRDTKYLAQQFESCTKARKILATKEVSTGG